MHPVSAMIPVTLLIGVLTAPGAFAALDRDKQALSADLVKLEGEGRKDAFHELQRMGYSSVDKYDRDGRRYDVFQHGDRHSCIRVQSHNGSIQEIEALRCQGDSVDLAKLEGQGRKEAFKDLQRMGYSSVDNYTRDGRRYDVFHGGDNDRCIRVQSHNGSIQEIQSLASNDCGD